MKFIRIFYNSRTGRKLKIYIHAPFDVELTLTDIKSKQNIPYGSYAEAFDGFLFISDARIILEIIQTVEHEKCCKHFYASYPDAHEKKRIFYYELRNIRYEKSKRLENILDEMYEKNMNSYVVSVEDKKLFSLDNSLFENKEKNFYSFEYLKEYEGIYDLWEWEPQMMVEIPEIAGGYQGICCPICDHEMGYHARIHWKDVDILESIMKVIYKPKD